jgi:hypothetical protein
MRSELEERFLRLCGDHGHPRPSTATPTTEAPSAFESDRERDVTLTVGGRQVLRFTWAQITRRPGWVAAACRVDGDTRRQLASR